MKRPTFHCRLYFPLELKIQSFVFIWLKRLKIIENLICLWFTSIWKWREMCLWRPDCPCLTTLLFVCQVRMWWIGCTREWMVSRIEGRPGSMQHRCSRQATLDTPWIRRTSQSSVIMCLVTFVPVSFLGMVVFLWWNFLLLLSSLGVAFADMFVTNPLWLLLELRNILCFWQLTIHVNSSPTLLGKWFSWFQ